MMQACRAGIDRIRLSTRMGRKIRESGVRLIVMLRRRRVSLLWLSIVPSISQSMLRRELTRLVERMALALARVNPRHQFFIPSPKAAVKCNGKVVNSPSRSCWDLCEAGLVDGGWNGTRRCTVPRWNGLETAQRARWDRFQSRKGQSFD